MDRRILGSAAGIALVACVAAYAAGGPDQGAEPARARVGVFDSRAVAIAWAGSEAFRASMQETRARYEAAKAAGDQATIERIDAEMKAAQERLHQQGFSTGSVRDLLAQVDAELAELAAAADVDVIVSKWDVAWRRDGVELADVTDLVVAPFAPSEKTRKSIEEIRRHDPVAPGVVEGHDH